MPVATAPAATKPSRISGAAPYSTSVRRPAGMPWSGSNSVSGAGNRLVLKPEILIHPRFPPYIQPVDATGVSPTRPAVGAPASTSSCETATAIGVAGRRRAANAHRGGGGRRAGGPLCGHRRLQADSGAGATGPGHGGRGGMADERGGGRAVGPLVAFIRTRDGARSGLVISRVSATLRLWTR
jgi:hypothetical protein